MHKLNEEAYSNPEQRQRRATAAVTARRAELPDPNQRVSGTVAECSIHDTNDELTGTRTMFIVTFLVSAQRDFRLEGKICKEGALVQLTIEFLLFLL